MCKLEPIVAKSNIIKETCRNTFLVPVTNAMWNKGEGSVSLILEEKGREVNSLGNRNERRTVMATVRKRNGPEEAIGHLNRALHNRKPHAAFVQIACSNSVHYRHMSIYIKPYAATATRAGKSTCLILQLRYLHFPVQRPSCSSYRRSSPSILLFAFPC
jgi:hypothetical protein